jgi:hypothetical protein
MSGSRKARNTASISNNTNIFGIMGGLGPRVGLSSDEAVYRNQIIRSGNSLSFLYDKPFPKQYEFLRKNNLLSVNPLASGGVGKKVLLYKRTQGA